MSSVTAALLRRREDLLCQELDGEAVLYDNTSDTTYRLNETGYFIFKACDGTADIEAIARCLTLKYDVAIDTARTDVRSTVSRFASEGLLVARTDAER